MSDDSDDGLVTSKVYKTKSMEKTAQKQESQVIKAVKEVDGFLIVTLSCPGVGHTI